MQVVPQELSTALASVTIKNGEKLDFEARLLGASRLDAWLFQIEHDRYSVLVVIPYKAIVRVSPVGYHIWCLYFLRYFGLLHDRLNWNESKVVAHHLRIDL